ncbi:MAG TPA: S-methyl-5-thioribose-1-phosphate isomerase [Saprospiraceae bacterium]|nr:S-methyl-5-thioribose-1-phosphate isomerase [Saprospiraceae bacterium]
MKINNQDYRTIWLHPEDKKCVQIIDQRHLPHELVIEDLRKVEDFAKAIKEMHVRGAPLIGATAVYGLYAACLDAPEGPVGIEYVEDALKQLRQTRPTAVDLYSWTERAMKVIRRAFTQKERSKAALKIANQLTEESVSHCQMIGQHGLSLIEDISRRKDGAPVNILTHCNAGWIACIDHGTATAPIYAAHDKGIAVHVYVDETRPRNQGARLTAYELLQHGVPHTVIVDNAGGHLMQHGLVDLVIVGSDRTTSQGDVANKIGTYLKALAAKDNEVPFYVALPQSSFDFSLKDGLNEIPIETRSEKEVTHIQGLHEGEIKQVQISPTGSPAVNYGFDVTPARLVTGLITERGICEASAPGIAQLYSSD